MTDEMRRRNLAFVAFGLMVFVIGADGLTALIVLTKLHHVSHKNAWMWVPFIYLWMLGMGLVNHGFGTQGK